MTGFYRIWIGKRNVAPFIFRSFLIRLVPLRIFVPVSLLCLRNGWKRRRSSFSSLASATASRGHCVMTETTWVSFGTFSMYLPLKTLSHFPLNVGFLFLTAGDCSSFHNIVPNPEVSSSHHLISRENRFAPQSIAMSNDSLLTLQSQLLWSSALWSEGRLFL